MSSKLTDFKNYPIKDFTDWYEQGSLKLSPKFQRNSVWNTQAKSYLIDTILRGLPIPPIFMKEYIDRTTKKQLEKLLMGNRDLMPLLLFIKMILK